jgi:hypothetical protein
MPLVPVAYHGKRVPGVSSSAKGLRLFDGGSKTTVTLLFPQAGHISRASSLCEVRAPPHPLPYWPDLAADWLERAGRPTGNLISTRERARRVVTLERNINAMSIKYEDNFGFYCIDDDDPEELEFFCHIRAQSGPTICARCNQKVRLLEHVKICATCAEALEYGAPQIQLGLFLISGQ